MAEDAVSVKVYQVWSGSPALVFSARTVTSYGTPTSDRAGRQVTTPVARSTVSPVGPLTTE